MGGDNVWLHGMIPSRFSQVISKSLYKLNTFVVTQSLACAAFVFKRYRGAMSSFQTEIFVKELAPEFKCALCLRRHVDTGFAVSIYALHMGLINKVDMVCLSPVGYGV